VRVVLAPDSFKGSLTAAEVCDALAEGWLSLRPGDEMALRPMADGGEGTLDAIARALPQARRFAIDVLGANLEPRSASWLLLPQSDDEPKTAVVELASACGIEGLRELAPMTASTFGLGQVIEAAVRAGAKRIFVGLGSSASTDGGAGMLAALGARLRDAAR
jgi:glycerate 2-kinase